eukprot:m.483796 g.483796  ORF g.483796 m.483796 type:complete len:507 (-) comp23083_c0_seq1:144-1664(-)
MAASRVLTLAKVSELLQGGDVREATTLIAKGGDWQKLEDLSACVELTKLDLSNNAVATLKGSIDHNTQLTWLNLAHNRLRALTGVERLTRLATLNVSHNNILRLSPVVTLCKLKALVASNNNIKIVDGLHGCRLLNSLILSHNQLEALEVPFLTELTKVSLSHNSLRQCPDFSTASSLKELRLNNNKIVSIPQTLGRNLHLCLLDLGQNLIQSVEDLEPLKELQFLQNLNLKGNPVASTPDYEVKVRALLPSLRILDNRRLEPKKGKKRSKAARDPAGGHRAPVDAAKPSERGPGNANRPEVRASGQQATQHNSSDDEKYSHRARKSRGTKRGPGESTEPSRPAHSRQGGQKQQPTDGSSHSSKRPRHGRQDQGPAADHDGNGDDHRQKDLERGIAETRQKEGRKQTVSQGQGAVAAVDPDPVDSSADTPSTKKAKKKKNKAKKRKQSDETDASVAAPPRSGVVGVVAGNVTKDRKSSEKAPVDLLASALGDEEIVVGQGGASAWD